MLEKGLKFVGEKSQIDEKGFSGFKAIGRKLYEYRNNNRYILHFQTSDTDWPFPDKYFANSFGCTVTDFLL